MCLHSYFAIKEKEAKRKERKAMSLKERYPDIGWHSLLEKLDQIDAELKDTHRVYIGIRSVERDNGMLKVKFRFNEPEYVLFDIQEAIAYRFERLSARMCEVCGKNGFRRTDLTETRTLCTEHYALQYSEEHPAPSLVAHQEPQKD